MYLFIFSCNLTFLFLIIYLIYRQKTLRFIYQLVIVYLVLFSDLDQKCLVTFGLVQRTNVKKNQSLIIQLMNVINWLITF